jgi:hypothetical protein
MFQLRDIIDEGNTGKPPVVPPEPGRRKIVCEFCECELGADGSYKKLSDKARGFREHDEALAGLQKTIGEKDREIAALKAQIPAPTVGPRAEGSRGGVTL